MDLRTANVTRYILPIEEEYHPVEKTYAPPYAIANCYSTSTRFPHRVGFQFLSGTVSYVLRTVYNFFFGITFCYDGLLLKPCVPEAFGDCEVKFTYLGNKFTVYYKKTEGTDKKFTLNGKKQKTEINEKSCKPVAYFADSDIDDDNVITVEY